MWRRTSICIFHFLLLSPSMARCMHSRRHCRVSALVDPQCSATWRCSISDEYDRSSWDSRNAQSNETSAQRTRPMGSQFEGSGRTSIVQRISPGFLYSKYARFSPEPSLQCPYALPRFRRGWHAGLWGYRQGPCGSTHATTGTPERSRIPVSSVSTL